MAIETPLARLKEHVMARAGEPPFIHASWFAEHHLLILEKLVHELCDIYPQANRDDVLALVWLHDYAKIVTNKGADEDERLEPLCRDVMAEAGYRAEDIERIIQTLHQMEHVAEIPPQEMLLEAKIMSSADAASHFIGPFFSLYWKEYSHKSVSQLIADNQRKIDYDFNVKAVLPEVRDFIAPRMRLLQEYDPTQRPERWLT